jgi:hypothetical protein
MRRRIKFRNTPDSAATYREPVVSYEYKVNGNNYSGDCVSFGSAPTASQQNQYKQGSSVSIFYKPNKPSVSVLEPGNPARLLPGLMVLLALAISFTMAVVMLYKLEA